MVKGISVVIPNFNGVHLFKDVLPAVEIALQAITLPSEIIVVDDCSTDESVDFLKTNFPSVIILQNETNSGFSVTANKGIYAASYNTVLLLNSDVKLSPAYFLHQLHYFEKEDTFGVMGRITGWDDDKIQDGAKYPRFQGAKIKTSGNYLLKDTALMDGGLYSMYLSGANALIDKEKFITIGGFNELFTPFYVEDYELSIRAWRLGYKCYFDYQSICRHKVSVSIKSSSRKKTIDLIYNRNKMFLHAIHLSGVEKTVWTLQLLLESLLKAVTLNITYLRSLKAFCTSLSAINKSRKQLDETALKTHCKKSVREIAHLIMEQTAHEEKIFF